jgi:hypothetical protein
MPSFFICEFGLPIAISSEDFAVGHRLEAVLFVDKRGFLLELLRCEGELAHAEVAFQWIGLCAHRYVGIRSRVDLHCCFIRTLDKLRRTRLTFSLRADTLEDIDVLCRFAM